MLLDKAIQLTQVITDQASELLKLWPSTAATPLRKSLDSDAEVSSSIGGLEDAALARRHEREKLDIERSKRVQAHVEKRERLSLEKATRRQQRWEEQGRLEMERILDDAHTIDNKAAQDFFDAARDQGLWKHKEFEEGELRKEFNEAAGSVNGSGASGDNGENVSPDPTDPDDGDDEGPRHRRRGRGFGYRRDSE